MGALNIPSAADIERLTRRLRSVSLRLEGIEDGVERLDRALSPASVDARSAQRLSAIEEQLQHVTDRLDRAAQPQADAKPARAGARTSAGKAKAPSAKPRTGKASAGRAKPAKA